MTWVGLDSGRPSGRGKLSVEECCTLDANRLRRRGVLAVGRVGHLQRARGGERVAVITVEGGRDRIVLSYRYRPLDGDWEEIREPVPIRWVPCRYGGERAYFACPGVVNGIACARRVAKLYRGGRYFLCRHCCGLTYASRNEDRWGRALRRANAIRTKLGGETGVTAPLPDRPKGMSKKTYTRLVQQIQDAESRAEERLVLVAARLMARAQKPRRCTRRGFWR